MRRPLVDKDICAFLGLFSTLVYFDFFDGELNF
jgi:hypothetical protein